MSKIVTTGKRFLKNDRWRDANGPIPGTPADWDPPMTDEEVNMAALSGPDAQPLTAGQLGKMLGLRQAKFAERFRIPIGALRDWEQRRAKPDAAATACLQVIEKNPDAVCSALTSALEKAG